MALAALTYMVAAPARAHAAGQILPERAFPQETREVLLDTVWAAIYTAISGRGMKPAVKLPPEVLRAGNGLQVLLFHDGKLIGEAWSRGGDLEADIRHAAYKAAYQATPRQLPHTTLVVSVFLPPHPPPRRDLPLVGQPPPLGATGCIAAYHGHEVLIPPLDPLLRDEAWVDTLLRVATEIKGPEAEAITTAAMPRGLDEEEATRFRAAQQRARLLKKTDAPEFSLQYLPGLNIASTGPGKPVARLYRLTPLVAITDLTPAAVRTGLQRAADWYRAAPRQEGALPYRYDPRADAYEYRHHLERRLLNLGVLGALAANQEDKALAAASRKELDAVLAQAYRHSPHARFGYLLDTESREVSLAVGALGLWAILSVDGLQGDPVLKRRAESLAAFLRKMRNQDGRYTTYYHPPEKGGGEAVDPGIAQWALIQYAQATNDQAILRECTTSYAYYREYFGKALSQKGHPPYQFIPWQTLANTRLYRIERQQAIANFVFDTNRLLVETAQRIDVQDGRPVPIDQRGAFWTSDLRRRNLQPRIMESALYTLGLAEAFALERATSDPGDPKAKAEVDYLRGQLLWAVRYLLQSQVKGPMDALRYPNEARAMGGFRTASDDPRIRIDGQAFATFALLRAVTVLSAADFEAAAALAPRGP